MPVTSDVQIKLEFLYREEIGGNVISLFFKRPIGFVYEAGDWVDLIDPDRELKGGKVYSLTSSPTESELGIMFRKGQSPFKQRLQTLGTGDELIITHYGNDYGFHLRENRDNVLIAGGIGIAPFRSMLKEMVDTLNANQVQLLYLNKGATFLHSHELNQWANLINLRIHYINTDELKRKDRLKVFHDVMNRDAHHYFIAGPEAMVESTEHTLIDLGINPNDIRIDSFGGY